VHGDHGNAGVLRGQGQALAFFSVSHQPVRIFSVTGTPKGAAASTTAAMISVARGSSCIRAEPAHLVQTFLAGQPILMSMIWAPRSML